MMPRWVNLANLVTLLRLVLVPFIVRDIIGGLHLRALTLFFIAAVTDVIDGVLARSASGITEAGAYLDPIADKCLMSGVFLALGAAGIVPWWFVGLVFGRDLLILIGVLAVLGRSQVRKIPPSQVGKNYSFFRIVSAACWVDRDGVAG